MIMSCLSDEVVGTASVKSALVGAPSRGHNRLQADCFEGSAQAALLVHTTLLLSAGRDNAPHLRAAVTRLSPKGNYVTAIVAVESLEGHRGDPARRLERSPDEEHLHRNSDIAHSRPCLNFASGGATET